MDTTIQLKIEFENSLRRVSIKPQTPLSELRKTIKALVGIDHFTLQYKDEEGDLITVGSDLELREVLDAKNPHKVTRFIVNRETNGNKQEEQPKSPKLPFEDAIRSLADPQVVKKLQEAIFNSPIITDAVNQAAQMYLTTKGDVIAVLKYVMEQLPLFQAVIEEALNDTKETHLSDAFHEMMGCMDAFRAPFQANFPLAGMMLGVPFASVAHSSHHHRGCGGRRHGDGVVTHVGVRCDGCEVAEEYKQAALANKTRGGGRGGFIRGIRYKSTSLDDYDLCNTCYESGVFVDKGPFDVITTPQRRCGWRRKMEEAAAATAQQGEEEEEMEVPKQSEEEWVKVQDDLMTKWANQLQLLASLGFDKMEEYVGILEEENGEMEKVVNRIIRREAE